MEIEVNNGKVFFHALLSKFLSSLIAIKASSAEE